MMTTIPKRRPHPMVVMMTLAAVVVALAAAVATIGMRLATVANFCTNLYIYNIVWLRSF
jgi:hypothetical protein